jgi:hypothetical protein
MAGSDKKKSGKKHTRARRTNNKSPTSKARLLSQTGDMPDPKLKHVEIAGGQEADVRFMPSSNTIPLTTQGSGSGMATIWFLRYLWVN